MGHEQNRHKGWVLKNDQKTGNYFCDILLAKTENISRPKGLCIKQVTLKHKINNHWTWNRHTKYYGVKHVCEYSALH